jgi:ATP-binding protein involved in chromosome partitioning
MLGVNVIGELPLVPRVSTSSDAGLPFMLSTDTLGGGEIWRDVMKNAAAKVWQSIR